MQAFDLKPFTQLMAGIGELYGKAISEPLADIYWQALKSFELQDVQAAFKAHIHNPDCGQYFPKPADIVRFIEGSGEIKALQAWSKVERAIRLIGKYESLAFDDFIIHAVLEEMGGWVKLCGMTLHEMPFCANEFQKRYMGFVLKKPARHPRYLEGIIERENGKNGYPVPPLLLVGDPQKAAYLIATGVDNPLRIQVFTQSIASIIQQLPHTSKNEEEE